MCFSLWKPSLGSSFVHHNFAPGPSSTDQLFFNEVTKTAHQHTFRFSHPKTSPVPLVPLVKRRCFVFCMSALHVLSWAKGKMGNLTVAWLINVRTLPLELLQCRELTYGRWSSFSQRWDMRVPLRVRRRGLNWRENSRYIFMVTQYAPSETGTSGHSTISLYLECYLGPKTSFVEISTYLDLLPRCLDKTSNILPNVWF